MAPSFRSAWGSGYLTAGSRSPISIAIMLTLAGITVNVFE